jgi:hypothetical protein
LQPLHLGTDRGLGEVERLSRLGEATKVYDRNDRAEKFNWNVVDRGPSLHGLAFVAARLSNAYSDGTKSVMFHYI